jgi:hypothetical protein
MKTNMSSWIKIGVFILVGILFGGVMVMYSNSRPQSGSDNQLSGVFEEMFNSGEKGERQVLKSFPVHKGGTLTLNTESGEVDIESGPADEVSIKVDISGSDRRTEKFAVDCRQDGDNVIIDGRSNDESFLKWETGSFRVHYHIVVPAQYSISGSTAGGDLNFTKINGTIKFETSGGNINLESSEGECDVSTSGGDVVIKDVKGPVKLQTSGGSIRCDNVAGDLDAGTSGGDIRMRGISGRINAETSGGNVEVALKGENRGVELHTSGGNIRIEVPSNIKADLDASTTGGKVKCDMPITLLGEIEMSSLKGTINGGGPTLKAETSGGDIRIAAAK